MHEKAAGSSPTSSRWALETPITRARMGAGRRLSGERCGGCGTIGEEIVQQPPQSVFFNTGPDPTGTQTRKDILKHVQTRSEKEELPRKGGPGGSVANSAPRLR